MPRRAGAHRTGEDVMGGSGEGNVPHSVVDRAADILADAGHDDASGEIARVAQRNDVSLEELAAAVVEVAGRRRARIDGHLADVIRLHWSSILPEG